MRRLVDFFTPFPKVAGRALVIGAVAAICGATANLISPRSIPWVEDWGNYIEARALAEGLVLVGTDETLRMFEEGTHLIFDARATADFVAGRLPTAHSLPYSEVEEAFVDVQHLLTPWQPIVAYCAGKDCDESFLLAKFLREHGFTNVVLYAGGFEAWEKAGHPVEKGQ